MTSTEARSVCKWSVNCACSVTTVLQPGGGVGLVRAHHDKLQVLAAVGVANLDATAQADLVALDGRLVDGATVGASADQLTGHGAQSRPARARGPDAGQHQ